MALSSWMPKSTTVASLCIHESAISSKYSTQDPKLEWIGPYFVIWLKIKLPGCSIRSPGSLHIALPCQNKFQLRYIHYFSSHCSKLADKSMKIAMKLTSFDSSSTKSMAGSISTRQQRNNSSQAFSLIRRGFAAVDFKFCRPGGRDSFFASPHQLVLISSGLHTMITPTWLLAPISKRCKFGILQETCLYMERPFLSRNWASLRTPPRQECGGICTLIISQTVHPNSWDWHRNWPQ